MLSGDVGKVSDEFLKGYPSAVYGRALGSFEGDPCKWSIWDGEQTKTKGGEAGLNRRPTNKMVYLILTILVHRHII